jgi:hypothetical protein
MKVVLFINPKTHVFVSGLCLKYLHNIQDPVSEIIVITAGNHIKEFHQHLGFDNITYIDERTVCRALNLPGYLLNWNTKKFAILNLDKFIDGDIFLNVDADVLFNQPVQFLFGNKRKFYLEQDDCKAHYDAMKEMCGIERQLSAPNSFIADFMLFDRQYLEQMRAKSPALTNWRDWETIANHHDDVSEYVTYGNWLHANYPNVMLLEKSNTYYSNMKYHKFNPTQENLNANPCIIPMRNTYDFDIDWAPIYPNWKF